MDLVRFPVLCLMRLNRDARLPLPSIATDAEQLASAERLLGYHKGLPELRVPLGSGRFPFWRFI